MPEVAALREDHATPAASQASITSASRLEPPGWITAVAPASIAACGPSANGKKASEATTEPAEQRLRVGAASVLRLLDRQPHRVDPAHLAGTDPQGRPVAGSTIALERTWRTTRQAKSRSAHCSSVGWVLVATSISSRGSGEPSGS